MVRDGRWGIWRTESFSERTCVPSSRSKVPVSENNINNGLLDLRGTHMNDRFSRKFSDVAKWTCVKTCLDGQKDCQASPQAHSRRKSSLLTFKTTCDLLVLTGVWRPNPRRKNLHRLAFIFDRDWERTEQKPYVPLYTLDRSQAHSHLLLTDKQLLK